MRRRTAVRRFPTGIHGRPVEPARTAQEFDDARLQGFFPVSLQLQNEVNRAAADSAAKPRLGKLAQWAHRVLRAGRLALQALRSHPEDLPSLGRAFAGVPELLGFPASRFRVVVEGRQRQLKAALRDQVYRIGREAIINAYRHSGAREIEMSIEFRPFGLRVCVRDNGRGIAPEELQKARRGSWGLEGMRGRAERMGARLRVLSRAALGTEVELCVPGRIAFEQSAAPRVC
jgi:signal transduction histidine kinase